LVSLSLSSPTTAGDGLRPINLRTDLVALADLIEIAFSDTMDSSGRAAVRELRMFGSTGAARSILLGVNELLVGISLGYVWIADGKLVGNVSIYPADTPTRLGKTWIIANVATHPDYRGRGIARQLMQASMESIRERGHRALLQVDYTNQVAQGLYERLGFVYERAFTHWRRSSTLRAPPALTSPLRIHRRRDDEWQAEYALAASVRPKERGGVGWQRPLHEGLFRPSWLKALNDTLNFRSQERLVIRTEDERKLCASLWVESAFATSSTQLTMLVDTEYAGLHDELLLNSAVRRFGTRNPLTLEHPADDDVLRTLLLRYGFHPQRTHIHMRWGPEW
jgi:ribosomal protein S18 acetylase RimI-like enzyme